MTVEDQCAYVIPIRIRAYIMYNPSHAGGQRLSPAWGDGIPANVHSDAPLPSYGKDVYHFYDFLKIFQVIATFSFWIVFTCKYTVSFIVFMDFLIALLIGHSFIRRIRDAWIGPFYARGQDYFDISLARTVANTAGVSNRIRELFTCANGINLISQLPYAEATIERLKPSIIAFNVGSNDLAGLKEIDPGRIEELVNEYLDFAQRIISVYNVKQVILFSVLPRTNVRAGSPSIFWENMNIFNSKLKQKTMSDSQKTFVKIKGFYSKKIGGVDYRLAVNEWSRDGIHCKTFDDRKTPLFYNSKICAKQDWLLKFGHEVRFALLKASAKVENSLRNY